MTSQFVPFFRLKANTPRHLYGADTWHGMCLSDQTGRLLIVGLRVGGGRRAEAEWVDTFSSAIAAIVVDSQ